ncbi:hypothetical protein CONLIGDRAFT_113646 [Coniochaeta ligniaria NRRL 30616]|uniref:Uncharacterized protein n=1 Tax=Coniochaeta ligniaria NRRL 30616 TaxID=1408157 RepID=A0A1J7I978_9PEZI|nr:hypothetical protein CONLIGDRAFT_113646 [Coniochaeta ligniaria NRRL 30616]
MDAENSCPTCNSSLLAQDVPIHTLLCPQFTSLPPKPGPSSILGLLFPHDVAGTPIPTWIKLTSSTDDETSITFQSVDTSPVFPSSSPAPEVLYTERNTVRNRDTRSMLEIWTLPPSSPGTDEAPGNATVAALAEGKDGPFHAWTGPVLALAMTRATGFMVDPGSYRDVGLEDAGDVVDFLLDYENPEHGRRIREALEMLGGERAGEEGKAEAGEGGKPEDVSAGDDEEQRDVIFEAA